jgi:hypothetical protein
MEIVNKLCDLIVNRNKHGKDYGVILVFLNIIVIVKVPEGLIEFIVEVNVLI